MGTQALFGCAPLPGKCAPNAHETSRGSYLRPRGYSLGLDSSPSVHAGLHAACWRASIRCAWHDTFSFKRVLSLNVLTVQQLQPYSVCQDIMLQATDLFDTRHIFWNKWIESTRWATHPSRSNPPCPLWRSSSIWWAEIALRWA